MTALVMHNESLDLTTDRGETSDERLMARVQKGDRDAFSALVRKHAARLQRFAGRMTQNADDAADVAQETLLRLWQHSASWQPNRVRLTTWMFRIAHNLCIDAWRRRHPLQQGLGNEDVDVLTLEDDAEFGLNEMEGNLAREQQGEQIQRCIAALSERQRTALVLCFFEGFSNGEAAAVLNVSVDALESLLARARRNLRRQLRGDSQ